MADAKTAANKVVQKTQAKKSCPECGGVLQRVLDGSRGRVRSAHSCGSCGKMYGKLKQTRFGCA